MNLLKSKTQDELKKMPKSKKKIFLSNDFSERIMRVEQKVSAKFGNFIPYNQTEYYKSMSPVEKKRFESYLKNKQKKKLLIILISLIALSFPFLVFFLLNFGFTGSAVQDNIGEGLVVNLFAGVMFAIVFFIIVLVIIGKVRWKKQMSSHIEIIEGLSFGKVKK
jgi:hypothetical protein